MNVWMFPLLYKAVPTQNRDRCVAGSETQLPVGCHPGAFGVRRKHHIHEGVDLYARVNDAVYAVESGIVVGIEEFTGPNADPPSPWWLPTKAVLVQGSSGVVLYGEISPLVAVGTGLIAGQLLGTVQRVLVNDKGYPTSMLHLELHVHGTRTSSHPWDDEHGRPASLLDPTPFLLEAE